jgi:hypothetical protein
VISHSCDLTQPPPDGVPYRVVLQEHDWTGLRGFLASEFDAVAVAKRGVDDATRNTLSVDLWTGSEWKRVGYAALDGEGGVFWHRTWRT